MTININKIVNLNNFCSFYLHFSNNIYYIGMNIHKMHNKTKQLNYIPTSSIM